MDTKSLLISPLIGLLVICGIYVQAHNASLVVPFSDIPVELDGIWTQDDWNDSIRIDFQSADGKGSVYVCAKYYAPTSTLYVAYVAFDETYSPNDAFSFRLDMNHDGGGAPRSDDFLFSVTRDLHFWVSRGTGTDWEGELYPRPCYANLYNWSTGWSAETEIPMNITDHQVLGVAFRQVDFYGADISDWVASDYPAGIDRNVPDAWADAVFEKKASSISLSLSPSRITFGEGSVFAASISTPASSGTISLQKSNDGIVWTTFAFGTPSAGRFSSSWKPDGAGAIQVRAVWTGDLVYRNSTSPTYVLTIEKASSTITVSIASSEVPIGQSVLVTGQVSPGLSTGTVEVQESEDGTSWKNISSVVPSSGAFSVLWTPPAGRRFYLRASWSGDENHEGSVSATLTLDVGKEEARTSVQQASTDINAAEAEGFWSGEAKQLLEEATTEYSNATVAFNQYDYESATTHAQNAIALTGQAHEAESSFRNMIILGGGILVAVGILAYVVWRRGLPSRWEESPVYLEVGDPCAELKEKAKKAEKALDNAEADKKRNVDKAPQDQQKEMADAFDKLIDKRRAEWLKALAELGECERKKLGPPPVQTPDGTKPKPIPQPPPPQPPPPQPPAKEPQEKPSEVAPPPPAVPPPQQPVTPQRPEPESPLLPPPELPEWLRLAWEAAKYGVPGSELVGILDKDAGTHAIGIALAKVNQMINALEIKGDLLTQKERNVLERLNRIRDALGEIHRRGGK